MPTEITIISKNITDYSCAIRTTVFNKAFNLASGSAKQNSHTEIEPEVNFKH